MPVIVVTRLRLKDKGLFDDFFAAAVTATEQATGTDGNLAADVLADAGDVYWTRTSWRDRSAVDSYAGSDPHRTISGRLDEFCCEATFVDWEQADGALPDWQVCYRHIVADGTVGPLSQPSDANATRAFPAPVTPS
jgi:hypothetical protein